MSSPELTAALNRINERDGESYDTLAQVSISVDGLPVWPVWGDPATNLDIFADDLLSFLLENWKRLLLEQDYPAGLNPAVPAHIWASAQASASGRPQACAETLFSAVTRFERSHDLSKAIGGQFGLPPFWMVRHEEGMLIETGGRALVLALEEWLSFVTRLGQESADRLSERAEQK